MHIFNVWTIIMQRLNIKEWKLFELLDKPDTPYTFRMEKISKFNSRKKWEIIYQMYTKWEVHIFNVYYARFEYKGMKTVGVTDYTNQTPSTDFRWKKCLSPTPLKNENIFIKWAQNRRCTSSICEQPVCKVWIKRNESFWSYRLHKLGTPKVLRKDRQRNGQKGGWSGPTTRPAFAKATQVKNQFSYFSTNTCVVCTQRDSSFEHPNKCLNLWIRKYNSQFLISRELSGIQHLWY